MTANDMRVIFDTNILILSMLGDPATAIMQAAFTGIPNPSLAFYFSDATFCEYQFVLKEASIEKPDVFRPNRVAALLAEIERIGHRVYPAHTLDVCSHEPDNRFLECAVAIEADYIVTVNLRHFPSIYQGTKTIPPSTFYALLFD